MANNKKRTVFQKLSDVVIGAGNGTSSHSRNNIVYNFDRPSEILYTAKTKEERDRKLAELRQQKLMAYQWAKVGRDTKMEQLAGMSQVRVMYRDADLMDQWPEIASALDIIAEESTTLSKEGKMINVKSKSKRIVSVLEDLFNNRLDMHIMAPMVIRAMCKYGNEFMFLNVDSENGVTGWRELPVHEMRREEGGYSYSGYPNGQTITNLKPDEVKFVWEGHNESTPFFNWQVAHFRLIKDSIFLPYGCSYLNKARRHWRMLSMMEDAMLLYRLERSVERRIFKVNVGLIDDADVPAFLQEFMNNVKRAPIIDPQTGQIDLRKNFLDVSADYVIPVRPGQDPTSIETLQGAQNQTSMDDIQYIENKVLSALRVPKSFLNFQEPQGKGQNLSLVDIRFSRSINAVQQAFIMELTKIAIIHLYLLGFTDDLTNFAITMNNPSNQIEMLELDNMAKRLGNATSAIAEQGGGIPLMSWHEVQKTIMNKNDDEISDLLNEIRLEQAIAAELSATTQIIKKTGLFKQVDRIYGEPGATYSQQPAGEDGGMGGPGGGGMPPMGGGFGDGLGDLGEPGGEEMGDIGGQEGAAPLEGGGPMESPEKEPVLSESKLSKLINEYKTLLSKHNNNKEANDDDEEGEDIIEKSIIINEDLTAAIDKLADFKEPKNILQDE